MNERDKKIAKRYFQKHRGKWFDLRYSVKFCPKHKAPYIRTCFGLLDDGRRGYRLGVIFKMFQAVGHCRECDHQTKIGYYPTVKEIKKSKRKQARRNFRPNRRKLK